MLTFFKDSDSEISGINVTPLVDVVLVLLVIFLITAPAIYQSTIKVQLPSASSGEASQKSPIQLGISAAGELSWNQSPISWEALPAKLKSLGPSVATEVAVVSADKATPHGSVIRLMDILRQQGLLKFALQVESATPKR